MVLTTIFTRHDYFLWGNFQDCVYHTNLHTVQELQTEIAALAEEIAGDV
jgi:hypothetical protein